MVVLLSISNVAGDVGEMTLDLLRVHYRKITEEEMYVAL